MGHTYTHIHRKREKDKKQKQKEECLFLKPSAGVVVDVFSRAKYRCSS